MEVLLKDPTICVFVNVKKGLRGNGVMKRKMRRNVRKDQMMRNVRMVEHRL